MSRLTFLAAPTQRLGLASLLLLCLGSVGCVESVHPLSDAKTSQADLRLLGEWQLEEDDSAYVVVKQKPGDEKVLVAVDPTGEDQPLDFYTVKLGDHWYMSILDKKKPDADTPVEPDRYMITRYTVREDGSVACEEMDYDFFTEAIRTKQLAGNKSEISDTPENIAAFLNKHGDKCWNQKEPYVLRRRKA